MITSENPKIFQNFNLKFLNTFKVPALAKFFVEIRTVDDLLNLMNWPKFFTEKRYVLGGGSNTLFVNDFDGLIIKNLIEGMTADGSNLLVGSGENWDRCIEFAIENNLYGSENLSGIPGSVGAAVVQNIGAYGMEIKDIFQYAEAIDMSSREINTFDYNQCKFGYRDSVFKNNSENLFITKVSLKLSKVFSPILDYADLASLSFDDKKNLTAKKLSNLIVSIRDSKLPDINEFGNAGSFFKNPIVDGSNFEYLRGLYPNIRGFEFGDSYKISAAWLIEDAGFKGIKVGDVGVSEKHALIIINYGNGTGKDIINLSRQIKDTIFSKYDINLLEEVVIV